MAKKKNPPKSVKKSRRKAATERVSQVLDQVKEPFSLLQTLKEEGMANMVMLFGLANSVASGASRNLKLEGLKPQLKEVVSSLGFALREDMERLEGRIEELELKISENEFAELSASDEE